jgi:hypothetical protein
MTETSARTFVSKLDSLISFPSASITWIRFKGSTFNVLSAGLSPSSPFSSTHST